MNATAVRLKELEARFERFIVDQQDLPDEAQGVIDSERKAAQTAGQSVTGKPYVPTLDEALDNPINKPPPR